MLTYQYEWKILEWDDKPPKKEKKITKTVEKFESELTSDIK